VLHFFGQSVLESAAPFGGLTSDDLNHGEQQANDCYVIETMLCSSIRVKSCKNPEMPFASGVQEPFGTFRFRSGKEHVGIGC
jgi:hypothetical protein